MRNLQKQNAAKMMVQAEGTYSYHSAIQGLKHYGPDVDVRYQRS
jgi:hypothetical protein